jgi:hypothetical protein
MRALIAGLLALAVLSGGRASAYSVLTHEANVDATWDTGIVPVLKQRFPRVTPEELMDAKAYAYGGCVIQDLGYYPFGSHFFSDLVHYVRSGDFVAKLVANAHDVNELAFALGALAHYAADSQGHPLGINRAVPAMYPSEREKFGSSMTYADSPKRHVIVEFSFDVIQAATGHYASDAYHKFIGFKVAMPLLEQTFHDTYGLEMCELFSDLDLAIGTYRHAVSEIIPEMTKVAARDKQKKIAVFHLTRVEYEKEYGTTYAKPKWWARLFGVLFKLVPKVGPFAPLSFKVPSPEAEKFFAESFAATQVRFRALLADARRGPLTLPNLDLDTGYAAAPGEYSLADKTTAKLAEKLRERSTTEAREHLR